MAALTKAEKDHLIRLRWKARCDKMWLARSILGYDRLVDHVHGPMTQKLQQFLLPPDLETYKQSDQFLDKGGFKYVPWMDPYDLKGSRRVLILFSRGYFKTTLNTITDIIQWILNFPHLGYALLFASDAKGQDTLKNEIKKHFQTNPRFRELFPDYCPQKRINDWGTSENFTVPNRDDILLTLNRPPRKEPTLSTLSIDKAGTGYHYDVIKCSDIVDPTNVVTPQMRKEVKYRFGLLKDLLVKNPGKSEGSGWINVEGTFYHYDDLYNDMVREWRKQLPEERRWDIFIGGCFQRETGEEKPRFDPNELLLPFRKDKTTGKRIPTWPEMDSIEKLEAEEKDPIEGGMTFAAQRILDLDAVNDEFLKPLQIPLGWVKRDVFRSVPIAYHLSIADLADTQGKKANPSCISTFAIDRGGRAYLHDVRHGKFTAEEIISQMLLVQKTYRPLKFVVEETAYIHGLKPMMDRESHRLGIFPNWDFHPAPRTMDKATRIIQTLQPALKKGDLRFVEPFFGCDHNLVSQILLDELRGVTPLSTGSSDDIIDTCAYLFLAREWMGREMLRNGEYLTPEARERLLQEMLSPKGLPSDIHSLALKKTVFPEYKETPDNTYNKVGW